MKKFMKMAGINGREEMARIYSLKANLATYDVWRIAPGDETGKQCVKIPHITEAREQIELRFLQYACREKIDWAHGQVLESVILEKEAVVFSMIHEHYGRFEVIWRMRQTQAYKEGQDLALLVIRLKVGEINSYFLRVELTDEGYVATFCDNSREVPVGLGSGFVPVMPQYTERETLEIGAQTQTIGFGPGRIVSVELDRGLDFDDGCGPCCVEEIGLWDWFRAKVDTDLQFPESWKKGLPLEDGWMLSAIRLSCREIHLDFRNGARQATRSGAMSGDFTYWPYAELSDMTVLVQSENGAVSRIRIAVKPGRDYGCNLGYTVTVSRVSWQPIEAE